MRFKRGVPERLTWEVNLISLPSFQVIIAALFHTAGWAHSPLNCISPEEASHHFRTIISHGVVFFPPTCDESTSSDWNMSCLRSVWEFKSLSFSATNCTSSLKRRTHLWWIRALRKYGRGWRIRGGGIYEKKFRCGWSLQRKTIKLGGCKLMPFTAFCRERAEDWYRSTFNPPISLYPLTRCASQGGD